jgi:hypothetical protein
VHPPQVKFGLQWIWVSCCWCVDVCLLEACQAAVSLCHSFAPYAFMSQLCSLCLGAQECNCGCRVCIMARPAVTCWFVGVCIWRVQIQSSGADSAGRSPGKLMSLSPCYSAYGIIWALRGLQRNSCYKVDCTVHNNMWSLHCGHCQCSCHRESILPRFNSVLHDGLEQTVTLDTTTTFSYRESG